MGRQICEDQISCQGVRQHYLWIGVEYSPRKLTNHHLGIMLTWRKVVLTQVRKLYLRMLERIMEMFEVFEEDGTCIHKYELFTLLVVDLVPFYYVLGIVLSLFSLML